MIQNKTRGIVTIAFGSKYYIEMALALGRSLKRFSPKIPAAIITDSTDEEINKYYMHVIPINKTWGENVRQKLFIDRYTPFDRTLFIDSDSLIVRDIEFVFTFFENKNSVILGTEYFYPGESCAFANVTKVCNNLDIQKIPRFNGGIYYLDKSEQQNLVFEKARGFIENYEAIGFTDFRNNGPADELLIGAAVELIGLKGLNDNGKVMRTPIGLIGKMNIDVIKGKAIFNKSNHIVNPAIVHFAGEWSKSDIYKREVLKLEMLTRRNKLAHVCAQLSHKKFELNKCLGKMRYKLWLATPKRLRWLLHGLKSKIRK
jgi:hypothetical protein